MTKQSDQHQSDEQKIKDFLTLLGIPPAQINFTYVDDLVNIEVTVPESDAGIYIGRYASVLDSLQLLIALMLNPQGEHGTSLPRRQVLLDIGGYRARRLTTLEEMAARVASEAETTHAPRALPPLSSTERRQIHLMFATHATLTTFSQGEGYDRRLFIAPKE